MSRSFSLSAGQSKLQNDGTFKISNHDHIIPIENEIVDKLFSDCSPPTLSQFKFFSNQLLHDFVQTGSRKRRITSENYDRTQENQSSASPSKVTSNWFQTCCKHPNNGIVRLWTAKMYLIIEWSSLVHSGPDYGLFVKFQTGFWAIFRKRTLCVFANWMASAGICKVVYLCIIFYSMHSIFALPGWRHECILKKQGVSNLGLVFWWRDGE